MNEGQGPGVGELIEQLQTVKALAERSGHTRSLADELDRLARLLEQRLDHLISLPERGTETTANDMPPNLDLFSGHPMPFEQRMVLDRTLLMEEMALWRQLLEEVSAVLHLDGERVFPQPEAMNSWLNRLEAWLNQQLPHRD